MYAKQTLMTDLHNTQTYGLERIAFRGMGKMGEVHYYTEASN